MIRAFFCVPSSDDFIVKLLYGNLHDQEFRFRNSLCRSKRKLASPISIFSNRWAVVNWWRKSRAAVGVSCG